MWLVLLTTFYIFVTAKIVCIYVLMTNLVQDKDHFGPFLLQIISGKYFLPSKLLIRNPHIFSGVT